MTETFVVIPVFKLEIRKADGSLNVLKSCNSMQAVGE